MNRIWWIGSVILLCCTTLQAQPQFKLGIQLGANSSVYADRAGKLSETTGGYQLGLIFRYMLNRKLYFHSGINILRNTSWLGDPDDPADQFRINMIEIPFMVGYKVYYTPAFKVRVFAGPNVYFVTKVEENASGVTPENYAEPFGGLKFGLGIDYLFFTADLALGVGLTPVFRDQPGGYSNLLEFSFGLVL